MAVVWGQLVFIVTVIRRLSSVRAQWTQCIPRGREQIAKTRGVDPRRPGNSSAVAMVLSVAKAAKVVGDEVSVYVGVDLFVAVDLSVPVTIAVVVAVVVPIVDAFAPVHALVSETALASVPAVATVRATDMRRASALHACGTFPGPRISSEESTNITRFIVASSRSASPTSVVLPEPGRPTESTLRGVILGALSTS